MFERLEAQSAAWRFFTLFTLAIALRVVFEGLRFDQGWPLARSVIGLVALIGLFGYAYGMRVGPRLFWAGFAIFFSVGMMIKMGEQIAIAGSYLPGMEVPGRHMPVTLGAALAMSLLVCLALFRLGGMLAGGSDGPPPARLSRKTVAYGTVFD